MGYRGGGVTAEEAWPEAEAKACEGSLVSRPRTGFNHGALFDSRGWRGPRKGRKGPREFEQVHRGYLVELAEGSREAEVRGEVTVVIAGANEKSPKRRAKEPVDGKTR